MNTRPFLPVLLCFGCLRGKISLGDLKEPEDIEEACEKMEPELLTLDVVFPAQTDTCPWGEADNLPPNDGYFTARVGQKQSLDLPDDSVICGMGFDFSGLIPGEVQVMVYDDHFFFTFNDIILAASYGPAVELMPDDDGLPSFDWDAMVGFDYHAEPDYDAYCLGDADGAADCDIPDTEVEGPISLSYSDDLVNQLSLLAITSGRYDFGFVSTGDDDASTDCKHEEFGFSIDVPYLAL